MGARELVGKTEKVTSVSRCCSPAVNHISSYCYTPALRKLSGLQFWLRCPATGQNTEPLINLFVMLRPVLLSPHRFTTFALLRPKFADTGNLREQEFILAHSFKGLSQCPCAWTEDLGSRSCRGETLLMSWPTGSGGKEE